MTRRTLSRGVLYRAAILCTILLTAAAGVVVYKAPNWLVVQSRPHQADIAVILGGGGGSRLRKGLALYDAGMVRQLVLVDTRKEYWKHMLNQQCPNGVAQGKVIFLEGSISTLTDAQLVIQYCRIQKIRSILVVTDPYHTRRALIAFTGKFKQSNIKLSVLSSEDFTGKLSPNEQWWQDSNTRKTIWDETGKSVFLLLQQFLKV